MPLSELLGDSVLAVEIDVTAGGDRLELERTVGGYVALVLVAGFPTGVPRNG